VYFHLRTTRGLLYTAMADHYKELGVVVGATIDDIKRAYRTLALQNHPDKTLLLSVEERTTRESNFKRVSGAYEVLSDVDKRAAYDAKRTRHPPPPPRSYYDFERDDTAARRAAAERRRAAYEAQHAEDEMRRAKKRQKRQEQREREEQKERERERLAGHLHATHPNHMRPAIERSFGPWKYEVRLTKLFDFRENTEPAESSSAIASELHIALKLDIVRDSEDFVPTEDLYIKIINAPGVVERFETYFKERCDGSCILTIILRATPPPVPPVRYISLPIELPINLRLNENWIPFNPPFNPAVRTTHLRFYAEAYEVPADNGMIVFEDVEMEDSDKMLVEEETRVWVRCGMSWWKRVAEMRFTRKWW
jgi:curved DNA-binding protein CbpA